MRGRFVRQAYAGLWAGAECVKIFDSWAGSLKGDDFERYAKYPAKVIIEEIKRRVSEYYSLRMTDLISARRARVVARPRQVAMYLCKMLTSKSLPEIGRQP